MDSDSLSITAGTVFVISSRTGDILPHASHGTALGFFAYDTRFLSKFVLTVNGKETVLTGSAAVNQSTASFYSSTRGTRNFPSGNVSIVRDRFISDGLYENISIFNHSIEKKELQIRLSFDADFADVFEVRLGKVIKVGKVIVDKIDKKTWRLVYHRGQFHRETWIHFSQMPRIQGKQVSFDITLGAKNDWRTCLSILPILEKPPSKVVCFQGIIGSPFFIQKRNEP
jgi:glycogen debranching enzyme